MSKKLAKAEFAEAEAFPEVKAEVELAEVLSEVAESERWKIIN